MHLSLIHGWIPTTIGILTVLTVVVAIGWRSRRWALIWVPVCGAAGAALTFAAYRYLTSAGLAGRPAPTELWVWIWIAGVAASAVIIGWRATRWWRRCVSLVAVLLTLLSVASTVNCWVGYYPTVGAAWRELRAGPLPGQTDRAAVSAMQLAGTVPTTGTVVSVAIDPTPSHFKHRDELVYLPPAWFATTPPPRLPTVLMIGGEFNTPTDWPRAGGAVDTLNAFAAAHGGYAPVVVFVDSGGAFNVDTECVNGPRGNAADHLTRDVVPFMISSFGVSAAASQWGVVGFSAGGTCAVDLTVMHPELFGSFVDIGGDLGPNSGTKAQTIDRLFGGNADAWASFDPSTVIVKHGHYERIWAAFVVSGARVDRKSRAVSADRVETDAATRLCDLGGASGMRCAVIALPGKHDWPFAGGAFAAILPWLTGHLQTPGTAPVPMPPSSLTRSAFHGSAPQSGG